MVFSGNELQRYNRHIILSEIGIEGQTRIKESKVLVIGAGGLGCPLLQYLAAAGVGTLGVIDHDVVDVSNLQRQILYTNEDIGFLKAERAVEKLSGINPHISLKAFPFKLTKKNALEIFSDFDIVVDGTDNFATRYLVNDACVILNKPLVFGSIFKFEGQVTVFNYENGPTYRCLFPEPPAEGEVPNCSQIGVIGVLPGIIGTLQANEVIKIITGVGEVLSGRLFIIDLLSFQTQQYKFSRNEKNARIKDLEEFDSFCGVSEEKPVRELDVYDLKEMIDNQEDVEIIDVRSVGEFEICNLGGLNIPLETISKSLDRIGKNKKSIVICHYGLRSKEAVKLLQETYSYENLFSLKGGINEWALFIDEEMGTY
ncbi:MAG TPA: molybdopterin-synthase adenylyltransferase MoeB [Cytophagales bacterium]|nr:molybdopterin-synthase adenylyltransferase MoeB [Cytophagales bacterium]